MIKMERACELIRQRRYRIYEISHKVGFDNAYYFTRVFHRHTGLSPSEYRKREGERENLPNL
jgi:two-component system response regulator YesN